MCDRYENERFQGRRATPATFNVIREVRRQVSDGQRSCAILVPARASLYQVKYWGRIVDNHYSRHLEQKREGKERERIQILFR